VPRRISAAKVTGKLYENLHTLYFNKNYYGNKIKHDEIGGWACIR
jgi:hypothetical protein